MFSDLNENSQMFRIKNIQLRTVCGRWKEVDYNSDWVVYANDGERVLQIGNHDKRYMADMVDPLLSLPNLAKHNILWERESSKQLSEKYIPIQAQMDIKYLNCFLRDAFIAMNIPLGYFFDLPTTYGFHLVKMIQLVPTKSIVKLRFYLDETATPNDIKAVSYFLDRLLTMQDFMAALDDKTTKLADWSIRKSIDGPPLPLSNPPNTDPVSYYKKGFLGKHISDSDIIYEVVERKPKSEHCKCTAFKLIAKYEGFLKSYLAFTTYYNLILIPSHFQSSIYRIIVKSNEKMENLEYLWVLRHDIEPDEIDKLSMLFPLFLHVAAQKVLGQVSTLEVNPINLQPLDAIHAKLATFNEAMASFMTSWQAGKSGSPTQEIKKTSDDSTNENKRSILRGHGFFVYKAAKTTNKGIYPLGPFDIIEYQYRPLKIYQSI